MNWDRIQGRWKQFTGGFQVRLATLTGDAQRESEGHRRMLAGGLQAAYGMGRDQAGRQIESWRRSVREVVAGGEVSLHRPASGRLVLEPRASRLQQNSQFLPITRRRQE